MKTDQKISLTELAKREDIGVSTLWRWTKRGVRGVRLKTFSVGARRYTDADSWAEFVAATTAAAQGEQSPTTTARTIRSREAEVNRAEADLIRAGA